MKILKQISPILTVLFVLLDFLGGGGVELRDHHSLDLVTELEHKTKTNFYTC